MAAATTTARPTRRRRERAPAPTAPPVARRLAAAAVDVTLVPVTVVAVAEAAWRTGLLGLVGVSPDGWRAWSWSFPAVAWTVAAAGLAYHAVSVARWGATPGKRLCGLRVEARDGAPIGAVRALGRAACAAALYLPWVAAPLLAVAGTLSVVAGSRRSPADRAAGTRVVRSSPPYASGRSSRRTSVRGATTQ
jgi:uncharacterized RDD family membrane protein YckC